MKKVALVLTIVILSVSFLLVLSACSGDPIVPKTAWGKYEQLSYEIVKDGAVVGTLVTTIERLEQGQHTINQIRSQPFNISSKSTMGIKYSQIAKDNDGKIIMHSVSILNGFKPLGSYKMVDYGDKNYTARGYLDGKYYKYWLNDIEQKRIKVSGTFIDNELFYTAIRVYNELDSSYKATITVVDSLGGTSEQFSVFTTGVSEEAINYVDPDSNLCETTVNCSVVWFERSKAPVGEGIKVWYSKSDFKLYGKADSPDFSHHIPVRIIENDMTYNLLAATAIAP